MSDFSLCVGVLLTLNTNINSVIFIPSFTHSKVVLNLNEFPSSAKPTLSHGNSFIFYEVANSYDLTHTI